MLTTWTTTRQWSRCPAARVGLRLPLRLSRALATDMAPHGVSSLCLVHRGPWLSRWGFTRCVPCLLSCQRRIRAVFHHELDLAWQPGARDRHRVNLGGRGGKLDLGLAGSAASGHESCLCQHRRAWLGNQRAHKTITCSGLTETVLAPPLSRLLADGPVPLCESRSRQTSTAARTDRPIEEIPSFSFS